MKLERSLLGILALMTLSSLVLGQSAEPGIHQLEVYRNPETKSLYWPIDKSVWIKLSPSQDEGAPAFSLFETDTSSLVSGEDYDKNGISLEISGQQFIRWAHHWKQDTVRLKFFADGEAPVSKLRLSNAPKYVRANTTFYGVGLTGKLFSADYQSGVKQIYQAINSSDYEPYGGIIAFDTEGSYKVRYFAIDNVGYSEKENLVEFMVDLSAPISRHEVINNFIGDVLSVQSFFQLSSTDGMSDIAGIYYRFDDEKEWKNYPGGRIPMPKFGDGEHQFHYYAQDRVKNDEHPKLYPFYLDKIPPVPDYELEGDRFISDKGTDYISPRTRIILKAEDIKIGVDHIEYAIDNDSYGNYTGKFIGPLEARPFVVKYRAVDQLMNMSESKSLKLFMDPNPPKSKYTVDGPSYAQRGVEWIKSNSKVFLSAGDDLSGLLRTEYKLAENPVTIWDGTPIMIPDEGRYLFRYYSYDKVNNREVDQAILIIVDDTSPTILETFSIVPTDSLERDGEMVNIYPRFTSVFLAAVDNSAGIDGIWFRMNDAPEESFKQTLFFRDEGEYTIDVRTTDNLGNESRKSFSFIIKDE
jgi:hypothetical protein